MTDDTPKSTFTWATVTALGPLRIRVDGDTAALPFTPDSLVDPLDLVVGDRVRLERTKDNHDIVLGVAGGPEPDTYTGTVSATWTFGSPSVTLSNGQTVTALMAPTAIDVQPGSTVLVARIGSSYIIQSAIAAPQFLRQIMLTPVAPWRSYDVTRPDADRNNQHGRLRVTKSSAGWVVCAGLAEAASATATSTIAILPVGFRPPVDMLFPAYSSTGSLYTIWCKTTGVIEVVGSMPAGGHVSLANIKFNLDVTWTAMSLVSPWTERSPQVARWGKDAFGQVALRGFVQNGTAGNNAWTPPAAAAYAPAAYPSGGSELHFATANWSSGGFTYANVTPTLTRPRIAATNSLDGILYPSSTSTLTWNDFATFYSSWANYGTFPLAGFSLRPDGLVQLKGLIRSGTVGALALRLPEGCRPGSKLLLDVGSADAFGRLDITPAGEIYVTSGSNAWVSLDGILFAPEDRPYA